jgi:hypothetical protein
MVLPTQSALLNPYPSQTEAAIVPRLGIILDVLKADDPRNKSAQQYQSVRGVLAIAVVYLPEVGGTLKDVVITPDIASGMDDYYEKFPRVAKANVNGRAFSLNDLAGVDPSDLDGDWCVVDFLNGRVNQPYIQRWWPNPRNFFDGATSGKGNPVLGKGVGRTLKQGNRHFTRINGVECVVTPEGDVWFSTKLSGSTLTADNQGGATDRVARKKDANNGGSILVNVKPSQAFDVSFDNHPDGVGPGMVYSDSLPQKNPNQLGALPALQSNTHIHADKSGVTFKVPVNFEVGSKGSVVANATHSIEADAPDIILGRNARQYVALSQDTIDAINNIEKILLAIKGTVTGLMAPGSTTDPGAAALISGLNAALADLLVVTPSVAATKVKAE